VFTALAPGPLAIEEVKTIVAGPASYLIEVYQWAPLLKQPGVTYVARFDVPSNQAYPPPMRLFVASSSENPLGWRIMDSTGTSHTGAEYQRRFPDVDQSQLSVTDIPMTDTFIEMLDSGWTPLQAKTFLLG
jgi:hypothetical protein